MAVAVEVNLADGLLRILGLKGGLRMHSHSERRKWERLPLSVPFFMRGTKAAGEEFLEFSTALNLSGGGALLAARRYLDPGTNVRLEIPVALANKAQLPRSTSLLNAEVLRCTADRQYFLLGLQFDPPLVGAGARRGGD